MQAWFFFEGGRRQGPVSREGLIQRLRTTAEPGSTLVWREGLDAWAEARSLPELGIGGQERRGGSPPPTVAPYVLAGAAVLLILVASTLFFAGQSKQSESPTDRAEPPVLAGEASTLPPPTTMAPRNMVAEMDLHDLRFRGTPINVDFTAAPLAEVARLCSELSGLPIVVRPEQNAAITLKANDMPWDEVFYRAVVGGGSDYEVNRRAIRVTVFRRLTANPIGVPLGEVLASLLAEGERPVPVDYLQALAGGLEGQAMVHAREGRSRILLRNSTPWTIVGVTYRRADGQPCEFVVNDGPIATHEKGFLTALSAGCQPGELIAARGYPLAVITAR